MKLFCNIKPDMYKFIHEYRLTDSQPELRLSNAINYQVNDSKNYSLTRCRLVEQIKFRAGYKINKSPISNKYKMKLMNGSVCEID